MRPLFGYHLPSFTFPGVPPEGLFEHVSSLAQRAESAGFAVVTVMDHFYQIGGFGPGGRADARGVLDARGDRRPDFAGARGAIVSGVTYRNPALLAKTVTTLDVISGGRAMLGLGAAWNESEHRGYGFDFPRDR